MWGVHLIELLRRSEAGRALSRPRCERCDRRAGCARCERSERSARALRAPAQLARPVCPHRSLLLNSHSMPTQRSTTSIFERLSAIASARLRPSIAPAINGGATPHHSPESRRLGNFPRRTADSSRNSQCISDHNHLLLLAHVNKVHEVVSTHITYNPCGETDYYATQRGAPCPWSP